MINHIGENRNKFLKEKKIDILKRKKKVFPDKWLDVKPHFHYIDEWKMVENPIGMT